MLENISTERLQAIKTSNRWLGLRCRKMRNKKYEKNKVA
jgi:hypothetical protein